MPTMGSSAVKFKMRRSPRLTRQRVTLFAVSSWVSKFALLVLALLWWLRPSVGELGGVAYPPSQCGSCTFQGGVWHAAGRVSVGALSAVCRHPHSLKKGVCVCVCVRVCVCVCVWLCVACTHACYLVVLVCLYWGGLGYGQCMLRTLLVATCMLIVLVVPLSSV